MIKCYICEEGNLVDGKVDFKIYGQNIGEFGAMICDEKAYGTCHFAIGNSKHMGGSIYCHGHFDNVIVKPTIWFDKKMVMKDGKLLL